MYKCSLKFCAQTNVYHDAVNFLPLNQLTMKLTQSYRFYLGIGECMKATRLTQNWRKCLQQITCNICKECYLLEISLKIFLASLPVYKSWLSQCESTSTWNKHKALPIRDYLTGEFILYRKPHATSISKMMHNYLFILTEEDNTQQMELERKGFTWIRCTCSDACPMWFQVRANKITQSQPRELFKI